MVMERMNISAMDEVVSGRFASERKPYGRRGSVRIVSWNIECGLQFAGILDFLRTASADLMLLQEVDRSARRTQHRDVARELAQSLGLNYTFGKEFQELGAGSKASPAYHGLATLSPWPLSGGRIIRFNRQSNFWEPRWYLPQIELFQRRLGGRITLVTEALVWGQTVVTYNLHLESRGKDGLRVKQLQQALRDTRQYTESSLVILGGDFNLNIGDGGAAADLAEAGFHDAVGLPELPTTAARVPFRSASHIDCIYVSETVRSEGRVYDGVRASDHHPVSATFVLP
jgi:endonuclease/exonuclease/phosphatase family metal-dependent hydrolase